MSNALEVYDSQTGEVVEVPRHVGLMADPRGTMDVAVDVAAVLKDVLVKQKLVTRIGDRDHVNVEGWTLLAQMMGHTAGIESDARMEVDGVTGWESTAVVFNQDGTVVSRGTGMCLRSEGTWQKRPEYAIRSMAQTRALSKALRLRFGFIVHLAGYNPTPDSEIPQAPKSQAKARARELLKGLTPEQTESFKAELKVSNITSADLDDPDLWESAKQIRGMVLEANGSSANAAEEAGGAATGEPDPAGGSSASGTESAPGDAAGGSPAPPAPVQGVLQDALDKRAKEKKA